MRETLKWIRIVLINGLLVVGLAGLLIAYLVVVSDLPSRVYTPTQQEYLSYNYNRSIKQAAPTWNVVQPGGEIIPAALSGWESRVWATLDARYKEQEGVSATIYDLDFRSEYHLTYPGPAVTTTVALFFPFPGNLETLHEVKFLVDGAEPLEAQYTVRGISWQTEMQAGEEHQIAISYRADGANTFTYGLTRDRRSNVLSVNLRVNGVGGSQVPRTSLPTTEDETSDGGETFTWDYSNLIANRDIQLHLPTRLSFAQRVAQLQDDFTTLAVIAPFLVGLFLASLAGLLHMGGVRIRLESYLLIGCATALFYPALTFLSGLMGAIPAAILALACISGLLLTFLGLTAGWRKTWPRAGWLLIIFMGIFSLGMLTPWKGLLITGGGLLLVGTFMLAFALRPAAPIPTPSQVENAPTSAEIETEPAPTPRPAPEQAKRHCPHCGRALAKDYAFCPGCGHDASRFRRCANCGHEQFVPAELEPAHCLCCGKLLRGNR